MIPNPYTYMVISDECINCGECAAVCPHEAIVEADEKCVVDSTKCDLTLCVSPFFPCMMVCPVECIKPDQ